MPAWDNDNVTSIALAFVVCFVAACITAYQVVSLLNK